MGWSYCAEFGICIPHRPPAIVMITAYGDPKNRDQASTYGADDFLTKPIDFRLLKQKLMEFAQYLTSLYLTGYAYKDSGGGR